MIIKSTVIMLAITALFISSGVNEAKSEVSLQVGTPNLSFSINDYQPAPPNVHIHNDRGRPYYVERDRRVYMEKKKHKKYKKKNKHHDHGHGNGRDR